MKIRDIYNAMNELAPFDGACGWDNCGLMCGDMDSDVPRALVTLDADMYALDSAVFNRCKAVISHHPLIFGALKTVDSDTPVYRYIRKNIAVISSHTCLDAADGGINDLLAQIAGIREPEKLMMDGAALGRYGEVSAENALEYIDTLKNRLHSDRADYILSCPIRRAAVVCGSGGSALEALRDCGCDTLITGEAKHEHFVYAENHNLNLLTFGHFETENIIVEPLCRRLREMLPEIEFIPGGRTEFIKRR